MELDHSAESAVSAFYLAGLRREIFNTVKILPRCVQQSLFNCLKKDLGFDFFYQFNSRGPSLNDSVSDSNESLNIGWK